MPQMKKFKIKSYIFSATKLTFNRWLVAEKDVVFTSLGIKIQKYGTFHFLTLSYQPNKVPRNVAIHCEGNGLSQKSG
jgi:hypothetical protein